MIFLYEVVTDVTQCVSFLCTMFLLEIVLSRGSFTEDAVLGTYKNWVFNECVY